jgi:hypothetical protein
MFNFLPQAEAILARLQSVLGANQVDLLEVMGMIDEKPRVLPSLSLVPPKGKPLNPENKIITAENSWTVVIVARSIFGAQGHLALMDAVCDALGGYQPPGAIKPLVPVDWGLLNERLEAGIASQVTFISSQRATIHWDVRNIQ